LSSASFNVLAFSTTPLRYQWRFNGTDIQAATNATFTIASVQPANDGQYSVAVTDAVGTGVSDAAHLTVLLHPIFTQQPTNRTIFLGTNATNITFSAASSSTTPVTYQWHFNGATVPGVTGGSFTISNAQVQAGGDFPVSVVATDTYGSIESSNATLRVILIPILTQQPQSQIVALGSTVTFSATASGTPPFSFRWRRNNAFVPGASYLTNSNTGLFTTNNVTTNSIYAVAITNLAGNTLGGPVLGLSSNAYLYVMAPPVDQTVNEGADATFTTAPQGLVPSINYQWKFNGGDLANATSASLTLTNVQAIAEGDYSVVVTITTNAPVPPATFTAKLHVISTRPRLTNPQVNPDRSFRGVLQAQLNQSYIVEISTNLANWTTLTNFLATNVSMPFIDVTATNAHQRFYRARTVSP